MNSSNKQTVRVGIFIFLGLLIFVVGILTIGTMRKSFVKKIDVRAMFDNVEGLQKGNNVWYSGVKVGTVKSLNFLQNSQVEVVFSIEEKSQDFIRQNARVKIGSDGLIGSKIIEVTGGTPKAPRVEDGYTFEVEKVDSQADIVKTLQENNKNILSITTDLKGVVSAIAKGEGSVGKLLNDEQLYANLTTTMNSLKAASQQAQNMTNSLNTFAAKINRPGYLANDLVTDTTMVPNIIRSLVSLNKTANNLQEMSANAKGMIADVKQQANKLLTDRNSPAGVLLHDEKAAANLRSMLSNLDSSSQKLDENLKALQSNILFRRYFKKQEKRESEKAVQEIEIQVEPKL